MATKRKGIFGILENVTNNVKKDWDKKQAAKAMRQGVYNEAFKAAEIEAIKKKACADANRKYSPPKPKPVDKKKLIDMNPYGRF